jgi:hypothetical protein
MPPRPPERALRRLVAELAALRPADREAVLSELEEAPRTTLQALLDAYREFEQGSPSPRGPKTRTIVNLSGLSPWLAMRLDAAVSTDPTLVASAAEREGWPLPAFEMTQFARRALAAAAVAAAEQTLPFPRSGASPDSDWFTGLFTFFLGRGAPA